MIIFFVFILGLFVGSFLNVVVFRLHRQETFVKGHSKCLFCGHRLYPKDLIPFFSYFLLKGKCRYCQHSFSKQYPIVELITSVVFVLIFIKIYPAVGVYSLNILSLVQLIYWWVIASFLIIIFVYDLRFYLILDKVILPAVIISFLVNLFLGYNWLNLLLAGVIGGGFFFLQFIVSKGKWIGGGDIRLGFLMGLILGWPHILIALLLAYVLGSIISIFLLLGKRKGWSDQVPFGTFLTLATFISLLYGQELLAWYLRLFNI